MSIEEAWRALAHAREEFERFKENGDPLLLRDACEKAWLAVLLAANLLLVRSGVGKPSSYAERKTMLRRLVAGRAELAELGLDDKFYARAYKLHVLGFHEGALDPEDLEEELRKAEGYPRIVESLLK
ncbi:MAG: PaREP1 family protein [Thermofilaceae archaeon]